jgi:hypothetical protein
VIHDDEADLRPAQSWQTGVLPSGSASAEPPLLMISAASLTALTESSPT